MSSVFLLLLLCLLLLCVFVFVLSFFFVCFFFFFSSRRRHTRCLSDWSSDVCSSDLPDSTLSKVVLPAPLCPIRPTRSPGLSTKETSSSARTARRFAASRPIFPPRSEERRVGKECRSRWVQKN